MRSPRSFDTTTSSAADAEQRRAPDSRPHDLATLGRRCFLNVVRDWKCESFNSYAVGLLRGDSPCATGLVLVRMSALAGPSGPPVRESGARYSTLLICPSKKPRTDGNELPFVRAT